MEIVDIIHRNLDTVNPLADSIHQLLSIVLALRSLVCPIRLERPLDPKFLQLSGAVQDFHDCIGSMENNF